MTDSNEGPVEGASGARTAGQMLHAARESQGMHLATLAAILKVPAAKLEALEADRYDELQGAAFTRALAQSACRALKIDPTPVLVRLPRVEVAPLGGAIGPGINATFRSAPSPRELGDSTFPKRWLLVAVGLLVVAAAGLWLLPPNFFQSVQGSLGAGTEAALPASVAGSAAGQSASDAASDAAALTVEAPAPLLASSAAVPQAAAQPALSPSEAREAQVAGAPLGASGAVAEPASAPAVAPSGGKGMVQLRALAPTWVEVVDATGQSQVGRILHQGEMINVAGVLPLRVKVGNVTGTEVVFQGHPVDLKPLARDNVARFELK